MRVSISKPYLGDMDLVGGLVRGFLAAVVDRLAEVGAVLEDNKGVAALADRQACLSMAVILPGRDLAFESAGQWSNGGIMADWMYEVLDHYYKEPETNCDALIADVFA